jgi:hypothetical protein
VNGAQLLATAALLGLFVLLAFGYGMLYGLGRLRGRRALLGAAFAAYGLQCAVAAAVIVLTPLLAWWKAFVALSCVLYFFIPPLAWRGLAALHRLDGHEA